MQALFTAIENENIIEIKKYLKTDSKLLVLEDEHGANLLAYALKKRCNQDVLDMLVKQGVSISQIDDEGVNVLEYAITYGNTSFVQHCIDAGEDVGVTSRRSGFTPLMAAVSYNNEAVVKMILQCGVSLFDQDKSGFTAMEFAKRMHRKKIQVILENYIKENNL